VIRFLSAISLSLQQVNTELDKNMANSKNKGRLIASDQASEKPVKKLLKGGVDPMVGKATQIKPGEIRNPGGRPKNKPITSAYGRQVNNPEHADRLAKALFEKACAGDVNAAKELREGIEGKALQAVRMEGELGISSPEERKRRVVDLLRKAAERVEGMPIDSIQ
jgi:hypothetical protein